MAQFTTVNVRLNQSDIRAEEPASPRLIAEIKSVAWDHHDFSKSRCIILLTFETLRLDQERQEVEGGSNDESLNKRHATEELGNFAIVVLIITTYLIPPNHCRPLSLGILRTQKVSLKGVGLAPCGPNFCTIDARGTKIQCFLPIWLPRQHPHLKSYSWYTSSSRVRMVHIGTLSYVGFVSALCQVSPVPRASSTHSLITQRGSLLVNANRINQ